VPYFSVLLVVAYEVAELLLPALQCGIKLLHLVHQVRFLHLQALTVRLHGCKEDIRERERERARERERERERERGY